MGWFGTKEEPKGRRKGTVTTATKSIQNKMTIEGLASQSPVSYSAAPAKVVQTSGPPTTGKSGAGSSPRVANGSTRPLTDVEEGKVVLDRTPGKQQFEVNETSQGSYSRAEDETADDQNSYEDTTRQNHLNSLFNGHLMKWKFEAEEGSVFVRVPAFFGAIGLIVTVIVATVLEKDAFQLHAIVMGVCVLIMGIFICILDGRFMLTNPLSTRAHLRNLLTRNFNMFRFVWGRGLLYIIAGVINISQMWLMTMISGAVMVVVGLLAVAVGVHASRKFAALRNSLADESFLLLVFGNYDRDGDGYLEPSEFALMLADLGMELDDRYTLKAFNVIDTDSDRKIAFDEFNHWWASGYIERGRKRYVVDDDDDTYQRMS
jgi:hypothetical protein